MREPRAVVPHMHRGERLSAKLAHELGPQDSVEGALSQIRAGRAVIVVDDIDDRSEGALVFAAESATSEMVAFAVRFTSGYLCVAMTPDDCERFGLPMMPIAGGAKRPAYTVTVDAREHITTGISAADRAHTMRLLASKDCSSADLTRPGHVAPLRACDAGVVELPEIGEAALDLARSAGLSPAGVFGHIVSPDSGEIASYQELMTFAAEHSLSCVTISQLVAYRRGLQKTLSRCDETALPTPYGNCRTVTFRDRLSGIEHVAVIHGDIGACSEVLISIHTECVTGDVFGSLRCQCRSDLDVAQSAIAAAGSGILLYLRNQQADPTVTTGQLERTAVRTACEMLRELDVGAVRLVSSRPYERWDLEQYGIEIGDRVLMSSSDTRQSLCGAARTGAVM